MPKKSDLMGLGMPPLLARRMATEPTVATSSGSTRASATTIAGDQYLTYVTGSNSGAGLVLPSVGGDGCCLGDDVIINNQIAPLTIYAPAGCQISMSSNLASGSGGVALASHSSATFYPLTTSLWMGLVSA